MLPSLALIILVGLALAALCQTIRLPRIIGMLFTGILLGPYVLNLLDDSILGISADLRQIALLIILLKAGLSLNLTDLKKVGRPAVLMSCLPASCEILAFLLFAPALLGINRLEAAVMGSVLAAVSPAVVVPRPTMTQGPCAARSRITCRWACQSRSSLVGPKARFAEKAPSSPAGADSSAACT